MRRALISDAENDVFGRTVNTILADWKIRCRRPDLASRFTKARMYSAIYRARCMQYPKIPKTLIHLGLSLGLPHMRAITRTVDGTDILFRGVCGNLADNTISVVFISGRMLQFLQDLSSLHADGTFKRRPKKPKTAQIFNIVTRYGLAVIAVARVLMMSRTALAYTALFQHLKELAPNLNPRRIHCDFEKGQIRAWRTVFPPPCQIVGCLWHYAVACSSKARCLGLKALAQEDEAVYSFIRCLCAVPLLPAHRIVEGVGEIWMECSNAGFGDTFLELFAYIIREWFPRVDELSVFQMPERTNSCSEADNYSLNTMVPQKRPNVYHLIRGFVKLELLAHCDKVAIDNGRSVNGRRRWRAVSNDARVQRSSEMLLNGDITAGGFLHRVSWTLIGPVNHGLRWREEAAEESGSDDSGESDNSMEADDPD